MSEKIKEARAWTDTFFTAVSGLSPLAAALLIVENLVGTNGPILTWASRSVPVPLYLLLLVPVPALWMTRYLTSRSMRKTFARQQSPANNPEKFLPNSTDEDVIRALRWLDGWPGSQRVTKQIISINGRGSQVDSELSLERLSKNGWAVEEKRDREDSPGKTYRGYRLTEYAVAHAMLKHYPIGSP